MTDEFFLALDGDDVGRRLELCMLTNDLEALREFSSSFDSAMRALVQSACSIDGVELVLFGGDSVMLRVRSDVLQEVLSLARRTTGRFTFSGGYAPSMREAYLALKLAKSSGKDRIEGPLSSAGR